MEAEKLLTLEGTGIRPIAILTKKGFKICAKLRKHKANGGSFGNFIFK